MTQQEIIDFSLQYANVDCVKRKGRDLLISPLDFLMAIEFNGLNFNDEFEYIKLRSYESITNKESDYLEFIDSDCAISAIKRDNLERYEADYFREVGVAVPFRNYPVEQMIEQGILKLKQ